MSPRTLLVKTKETFRSKWSARELRIPPWVINSVIWIMIVRAFAYGMELLFLRNNPISPLMAYVDIVGIEMWGMLILGAVLMLILGILTRLNILVTIGVLFCSAAWVGFALSLGIGWYNLGPTGGGRFFVHAAANASMFILFFYLQLRHIKKNGL